MIQTEPTNDMPIENGEVRASQDNNVKNASFVNTTVSPQNTSIPLSELLEKIPFAYSPVTKQLHLIYPSPENTVIALESESDLCKTNGIISNSEGKCKSFLNNTSYNTCDKLKNNQCALDGGACTEDDMSDELVEGASGLLETEGSSLSSDTSHQPDESLVNDGTKPKKRGISSFFSRGVFSWKSKDSSTPVISVNNNGNPGWKFIGRGVQECDNSDSNPDLDGSSSNCSSLRPIDSPASLRSVASGSKRYEDVVASSSALILHDRPANLPAKSSDEDAKHRQEYEQMVEAAKKKERQEAKQRKKQLQQQMKTEERLANATKVWINDVLPKWDSVKNCRRIRNLWWQGIPPCVRGKVWQLAIGNELNLTHQLYGICVARTQELLKAASSSSSSCDSLGEHDNPDREASVELIQLDISRTFPQLCIFQQGGPYYDILHSLLGAYACYRPDVGYVQGMSFLAAILILNMEEADAFVCFANLLNRPCHMAFFRLDQTVMQAYYTVFEQLMAENLCKLQSHFSESHLTPDLYLLDWLYTVFAKAMPLDVACRVWDVFLRDGEEFLFRTALGVLHLYQDMLMSLDFLTGAQFLTKLPEDLSADQLFHSIQLIRMNRYTELLLAARAACGATGSNSLNHSAISSTANSSGTATPADLT